MTRAEIERLTPAELDAAVEREVFGRTMLHGLVVDPWKSFPVRPAPYSSDMGAAWRVVEHLKARGWGVGINYIPPQTGIPQPGWCISVDYEVYVNFADDPMVAIIRAALLALAREEGE